MLISIGPTIFVAAWRNLPKLGLIMKVCSVIDMLFHARVRPLSCLPSEFCHFPSGKGHWVASVFYRPLGFTIFYSIKFIYLFKHRSRCLHWSRSVVFRCLFLPQMFCVPNTSLISRSWALDTGAKRIIFDTIILLHEAESSQCTYTPDTLTIPHPLLVVDARLKDT